MTTPIQVAIEALKKIDQIIRQLPILRSDHFETLRLCNEAIAALQAAPQGSIDTPIPTWRERSAAYKEPWHKLPPAPDYFMQAEIDDLRAHLAQRAASDADAAAKAVHWFGKLDKCARLLGMPDDQPITDAPEVLVALLAQRAASADDVGAALAQAADIAIKLTSPPRDLLGKPTAHMLSMAAKGQRVAEAIRAIAPAPKAIADEVAGDILDAAQRRMWEALDRKACPGVWMQIASDAVLNFKTDSYGGSMPAPKASAEPVADKRTLDQQWRLEKLQASAPDALMYTTDPDPEGTEYLKANLPDAPTGDLPPLPDCKWAACDAADGVQFHPSAEQAKQFAVNDQCEPYFTADQMRAYVLADRAARQAPAGEDFDAYAKRAGLDLSPAKELEAEHGEYPATYWQSTTEAAWRAWANKLTAVAPVSTAEEVANYLGDMCDHAFKMGQAVAPAGRVWDEYGRTNAGDETGGTVQRFGFDLGGKRPDIIPATNGAFVYHSDYVELFKRCVAPAGHAEPEQKVPCWSCNYHYTASERMAADGNCPPCNAEIEVDDHDYAAMAAGHAEPGAGDLWKAATALLDFVNKHCDFDFKTAAAHTKYDRVRHALKKALNASLAAPAAAEPAAKK